MTNTVQVSADLLLSKGQHRVTFRNPRGNQRYYVFYYDATGLDLVYEHSIDGIDWSTANLQVSVDDPESFDVKIRNDGSQLVVWVVWHNGTATKYIRGTIADASDTISFGAEQTIDSAINDELAGQHCISIARTDNGRLVVAFTEDIKTMGKKYRLIKLIGSDNDGAAPTWSGEITWTNSASSTNNKDKDKVWFGLEGFASSFSNTFLIVARQPSGTNTTSYQVRSSSPEWDGTSFTNLGKDNLGGVSNNDNGRVLSCVIDEQERAHAIYWDNDTTELRSARAISAGGDTWASTILVRDAEVDACTLTLDAGPATEELYAFYHDVADTADFHYKVSPVDVIVWGSEQTITFAQDVVALSSWSRDVLSELQVAGERVTDVVWYHSLDVSVDVPQGSGASARLGFVF